MIPSPLARQTCPMYLAHMTMAIEITDVTVKFPSRDGTVVALDNVSFSVETGQVCAFLGPNGAGKTTAVHVLLGFVEPTSGTAMVFGEDVRKSIARQRIGYLPEHPDTYGFLTGRELLSLTGKLFGMRHNRLATRVDEVLDTLGISFAAGRRIATYSRGMKQRVCLAQALINDPDLVILDEPTGGLDPFGRADIRQIISDLRDRGKTVFFSSHELSEAEMVCDHIVIVSDGRVVAQGATSELIGPAENLEKYFTDVIREKRTSDKNEATS